MYSLMLIFLMGGLLGNVPDKSWDLTIDYYKTKQECEVRRSYLIKKALTQDDTWLISTCALKFEPAIFGAFGK